MHRFLLVLCLFFGFARAEEIRVAAASDLQFALPEIITAFQSKNPGVQVSASYGSSGRFDAQIRQGAPFDLFLAPMTVTPANSRKTVFSKPTRGNCMPWVAWWFGWQTV